jgi:hypothetical protein
MVELTRWPVSSQMWTPRVPRPYWTGIWLDWVGWSGFLLDIQSMGICIAMEKHCKLAHQPHLSNGSMSSMWCDVPRL